jgi:hypothetical protein
VNDQSVRQKPDSAVCRGEPAEEWRSPDSREKREACHADGLRVKAVAGRHAVSGDRMVRKARYVKQRDLRGEGDPSRSQSAHRSEEAP